MANPENADPKPQPWETSWVVEGLWQLKSGNGPPTNETFPARLKTGTLPGPGGVDEEETMTLRKRTGYLISNIICLHQVALYQYSDN